MFTDFYNIWHTVYFCYWFTYLTYVLLLHYLEKVHNDNFQSCQLKLHITVTQYKIIYRPVCLYNQFASIQNVPFLIHTCLKSLSPFVNSTVVNALRQAIPCVDQALSQIGHVSNWRLIHTSLHHAPYSAVNRNKIGTIRRPEVRINKFRSLRSVELVFGKTKMFMLQLVAVAKFQDGYSLRLSLTT